MKTTIEADFTGKSFESTLHITRDKLPAFSGNVIILHGFRGSKEWMAISAAYFQFLGFNVFIPDLLGHGESNQPKGFGVKDVDYLLDFIDREIS
jgi:pimeloyl-ACP methyl ester carboxylesterase